MSGHAIQEALADVEPGELLDDMRFPGAGVSIRGLREGIVSASSPLADERTHTFVATNPEAVGAVDGAVTPRQTTEVTVAITEGDNGAFINLKTLVDSAARNPRYLREVIEHSAAKCEVEDILLDPTSAEVPTSILEHIGFRALKGDPATLEFHILKQVA